MRIVGPMSRAALLTAMLALLLAAPAWAGPIFLTGHDPDFHCQDSVGACNLLRSGLSFVTGGTYNGGVQKFLWVESFTSPPAGFRVGEAGLTTIGLTLGTNFDWVDATGLATVDFSKYTAIAIASSFGGMLTQAELSGLISRSADITSFINAGGGLLALAECFPSSGTCDASNVTGPDSELYSYLPVSVSSITPTAPFTVTAAGAGSPFFLTNGDINDPTHNSFGLIGGLTPLDLDSGSPSQATTLAGVVTIGGGGFVPVPAPATLLLLGSGLAGLAAISQWRRHATKSAD
jgi:hypothetical protein